MNTVVSPVGPHTKDLTGLKFNRLTVINKSHYDGHVTRWNCLCDCGNYKLVDGTSLRKELTKSCGCYRNEYVRTKNRVPSRETICVICENKFSYSASRTPNCCSKICFNKYNSSKATEKINSSIYYKLKKLVDGVIYRSKKLNKTCDITYEYVFELLKSQNGRCLKTGMEFELKDPSCEERISPYAPSLDQIIPGNGYIKGNVQLVSMIYNYCKHTWTHEQVTTFAKAILENNN